jgi:serine/threonine protein kinase
MGSIGRLRAWRQVRVSFVSGCTAPFAGLIVPAYLLAMSGAPATLAAALADRYQLERIVGRGGMATVYLARDVKHDRQVAVKVLAPEIAASLGTDRFLKEIEIAARLTHPHIVPLYDSGQADGFLYFVMPYIEGPSLRGVLHNEGRRSVATVVAVARQVADALAHAHRAGVLHRDVKPENILLSEGHAFVADFGVAKAVSSAGGATLTRTGFAMGTPGYMSPEQAAGVREIDARTDVYGLACVAYELLIGETPGLWATETASRLGRFVDASPEHRARLDELPGRVEQVLARALAMRPADRFATPLEFVNALAAASESQGRYGAGDVREVIGRAAELQAALPADEGVLTVGALEQVAAEVGIPPERVREALRDLGLTPGPDGGSEQAVELPPAGAPDAQARPRYRDSEVDRILGRAAEIDARPTAPNTLLTVGAIERVAAEVGIPSDRVRQAVEELRQTPAPTQRFYGRPTNVIVERSIGVEVTDAAYPLMLDEIRRALGTAGQALLVGNTLSWNGQIHEAGAEHQVRVSVTPREGRTHILLEEPVTCYLRRLAGSVGGWIAGGLLGVAFAFGLGLGETSVVPVVAIAFSAVGAYAASRSVYVQAARERERKLGALGDRLIDVVKRIAAPAKEVKAP